MRVLVQVGTICFIAGCLTRSTCVICDLHADDAWWLVGQVQLQHNPHFSSHFWSSLFTSAWPAVIKSRRWGEKRKKKDILFLWKGHFVFFNQSSLPPDIFILEGNVRTLYILYFRVIQYTTVLWSWLVVDILIWPLTHWKMSLWTFKICIWGSLI